MPRFTGRDRYKASISRKTESVPSWEQSLITSTSAEGKCSARSVSVFMAGLKRANIDIDRKVLADLAVADKAAFAKIAGQVKASLAH